MKKGKVHIIFGTGMGKTAMALGRGVSAAMHGRKVIMIQFLKGVLSHETADGLKQLEPAYKPMIKTALSAQAPTFIHLRFLIAYLLVLIEKLSFMYFYSGVFLLFHGFKLFLLYSSYHLFYFSTIHTAQDVIFLHKM